MIDHAPRILAEARQAAQKEQDMIAIADLEQRSAPLHWAVFAAVIVLCLATLNDAAHQHLEQDQSAVKTNDIFVQCLNGKTIKLGDSILHCEVRHYQLIAGVSQ